MNFGPLSASGQRTCIRPARWGLWCIVQLLPPYKPMLPASRKPETPLGRFPSSRACYANSSTIPSRHFFPYTLRDATTLENSVLRPPCCVFAK